jgi:hypothetical protein
LAKATEPEETVTALGASAIFDGMRAADGRLYLTPERGQLVRMEDKKTAGKQTLLSSSERVAGAPCILRCTTPIHLR